MVHLHESPGAMHDTGPSCRVVKASSQLPGGGLLCRTQSGLPPPEFRPHVCVRWRKKLGKKVSKSPPWSWTE